MSTQAGNPTSVQDKPARGSGNPPNQQNNFTVVNGGKFFQALPTFLKNLPNDYLGTLEKVQSHHGKLVHWRLFGGLLNFAFICDALANRETFVRHADALAKSPSQVQTFLFAAGHSIATAQGDDWRVKRKEANNLFSRSIVEAPCAGQVEIVRDYIKELEPIAQNATTIARRLAALTSSRGILGRAISIQEADTQIAFSKAAAKRFNAESAQLFARPNWMQAPWRRELARRKEEVFPIVARAMKELRKSDSPNDGLMKHYVNGDFVTSSDDEMRVIMVGLLMGAQDNISAAAAWMLAFLALAPQLQEKIYGEIETKGTDATELQNCKLLQATVLEALRMRPPAPANQPRRLTREVKIAGHTLPKGTHIFNSIYNMHHDPEVYPHPDKFDPERFVDGNLLSTPSFAPFGHGPRNCVAQHMAQQQLAAILFGILREKRIVGQDQALPKIEQQPFLFPTPFNISLESI